MLGRIFGPKAVEAAGGWKELHNMELHKLCSLLNIIKLIRSRWMRWEGCVACMVNKRNE
jgi:hypothetical protein